MGLEIGEEILTRLDSLVEIETAILEEIKALRRDGEKARTSGLNDAMKVVEGTGIGEILKNIGKGR